MRFILERSRYDMTKYIIGTSLLLLLRIPLWGQQPEVVPLERNPALYLEGGRSERIRTARADTVNLPFIDDFSYYAESPYPDQSLWMDRYVFINNDYPVQPRSNGVATFDALDADGKLYNNNSPRFAADTLTSRPVNLGESGVTNVYLSFFYQPQGIGDNPETGDSLILQFKSADQEWRSVWNTPGTTVQPFKRVLMPVPPNYLHKGFQFRFVNMVSLEVDPYNPGAKGNADHWHIDYVSLKDIQSPEDTAILDVAVIAPLKSLIKGYTSIPWNQFRYAATTRLESQISITYRNNYYKSFFIPKVFEIRDIYHPLSAPIQIISGGENLPGGKIETFYQDLFNPFISTSVDSALFELKGYLQTDDADRKENDTVRFYQTFKNYFARDDGTPESGYGYRGINAQDCAIACRYETFTPDSVQAIALYFNPTDSNNVTSRYIFKIAVWKDDNGRPGEQVYLSNEEYSIKEKGKYVTYVLEKPIYVTKYYWIGWQQVTSGFLNVGFDRSYNDQGNLCYNSSGVWQTDVNKGTLMIRPFLGKRSDFYTSVVDPETATATKMRVYPNPASQYIYIAFDTLTGINPADYDIEIYGQTGRLRYRRTYTDAYIDVSSLEQGLYIVRLVHKKTKQSLTQKILINR